VSDKEDLFTDALRTFLAKHGGKCDYRDALLGIAHVADVSPSSARRYMAKLTTEDGPLSVTDGGVLETKGVWRDTAKDTADRLRQMGVMARIQYEGRQPTEREWQIFKDALDL
jgi:hypothetical protein